MLAVLIVPLTTAAIELEAVFKFVLTVPICVLVLPLTTAAIDELAVVRSDCNARAPTPSVPAVSVRAEYVQTPAASSVLFAKPETCFPTEPAVVSVDVATFQMSAVSVPNVVSERMPLVQTLSGIVAANDEEAVRTVLFVLVLIVVIALLIVPLTTAAIDEDAVLRLPLTTEAIELEAVFKFVFTAPT